MRPLATLALAVTLAGCVTTGKYDRKAAEADQLRADAARLGKELADEKGERAALDAKLEALQAQQAKLSGETEGLRADLEKRKATADQEVKALEARLAAAEAERREYASLADSLRGEIDAGRVELSSLKGRMTVKMKDKILFPSGSATLNRDGRKALAALAAALRGLENRSIRVEGHTDDRPTAGTVFPSNWELSVARALAVVRFLQGEGLDPHRLAAAGYGEHQPVAQNDTPEGRSQNRRIEIVLAPLEAAEPAAAVEPVKM
jgi:chemotaxis protein MotB